MEPADTMSPSRRHLTNETVARIQVSLSSRKTSVVVFNTSSRLISLEEGEWRSVAYGAPCILLLRHSLAPDATFEVHLVIADLDSGISVWEEELKPGIDYNELQPGFHTFSFNGQMLAIQFANPSEASSLFDSLQQYLAQKKHADKLLEERMSKSAVTKNSNSKKTKHLKKEKRLSKFEISMPCEFRHISGITADYTEKCRSELENAVTATRRRSSSMSSISHKQTRSQSVSTARSICQDENEPEKNSSRNHKPKFHSFRLARHKKPLLQGGTNDDMILNDQKQNPISRPLIIDHDTASTFFSRNSLSSKEILLGQKGATDNFSETVSPTHAAAVDTRSPVHSQESNQPTQQASDTSNMYDFLLPLSPSEKSKQPPVPLKPLAQNCAKKVPHASPVKNPLASPAKNPPTSPTENLPTSPANNLPISPAKKPLVSPIKKPLTNPVKSPPMSIHIPPVESSDGPATVSPLEHSSSKDQPTTPLDCLSDELTRVLREFDEIISPKSPLDAGKSTRFTYPRKETMV